MDKGPCTAWALAAAAMSHSLDAKPLPRGLSEATVGNWAMRLNNGGDAIDGVEPFGIELSNTEYLAFGLLHPAGGMIGGWTEDRFILEMAEQLSAADREVFAKEIAATKAREASHA